VEDHVGRHALLPRGGPPPGPELLEHRCIRGRQLRGVRLGRARAGGPGSGARRFRHGDVAAEHDLALAAQHLAAGRAERQRLVLAAHFEQPAGEQLADHAAPFCLAQVGADAEGLQLVVGVLRHPVGLAAEQDVDGLARAEALVPLPVQPHDRRQQLLRGHRAVPDFRRGQARVAVGAGSRPFRKIGQELHPAAVRRLAEGEHRIQMGRQPAAVREVALGRVDQPPLLHDVGEAVGEPGGRGLSVPAGSSGLLVVALHRPRQVQVRDEPDIRLVDPHPERDRRDHHQPLFAQEAGLVLGAGGGVEPGVVRHRGDAAVGQERRDPLGGIAGQAVDDPRVARVLSPQEVQQLLLWLVFRNDPVLHVRPVE
jgi:hypothetical protein